MSVLSLNTYTWQRPRHWTDTFCLWRWCLVLQDENIGAEHQDSQTVSCRV